MPTFPNGFVWGVSTAAYQIEGAVHEGGRGASIWDTFSHTPGRVANGDTGDVACDHVHRYREDVDLMADLGVDAYRFSVAWSRLFPEGRGRPNRSGRDFYDRLIDTLLEAGVAPWICPFHWDLPQALQDRGGWSARDTVHHFTDYVAFLAEAYGDRVGHFLLINEPNVYALLGHLLGVHAPGVADVAAFGAATHHLNLATGQGIELLRSLGDWQLGTVLNLQPVHAVDGDDEGDLGAAALFDAVWNRNALDPLLRGSYPDLTHALVEPFVVDGDLDRIHQRLDLLGVNYYTRVLVRADPASLVGIAQAPVPADAETTATGWEVTPDALREQLLELKCDYGNPPVFVTENGAAFADEITPAGSVHDTARVRYLERHLAALHEALEAGADVRGYFVWSLLDNFEWTEGYQMRFGIVHVDFANQERTLKASFARFREIITDNGFTESEG